MAGIYNYAVISTVVVGTRNTNTRAEDTQCLEDWAPVTPHRTIIHYFCISNIFREHLAILDGIKNCFLVSYCKIQLYPKQEKNCLKTFYQGK
jgi:hypothetical protein